MNEEQFSLPAKGSKDHLEPRTKSRIPLDYISSHSKLVLCFLLSWVQSKGIAF